MKTSRFSFPRRVRIHGGECGAVARALHHAAQKEALMPYESAFLSQADSGKSLESTFIERKQMSTKTSIKRIALVAVSALGFGLLSVMPAKAVDNAVTAVLDSTGTLSNTETATALAGANNYVVVQVDQDATDPTVVVATGGTLVNSSLAGTGTSSVVVSEGTGTVNINVPTPTAGTITVKSYAITNGVQATTAASTVTITVLAAASGTVYSSSSVAVTTPSADARIVVDADGNKSYYAPFTASSSAEIFTFTVTQKDAAGDTMADASAKALTATLTGSAGALSVGGTDASGSYGADTLDAVEAVHVYADGRAGTGVLTIAVNGATVATYSINFYNTAASSYVVTQSKSYIGAASTTGVYSVKALDANGFPVPGASVYGISGTTATATIQAGAFTTAAFTCSDTDACTTTEFAAVGKASITVVGVAKGTTSVTFQNAASTGTPTVTSAATTLNVTGTQVASLAWAFDKATYLPGEEATITFTLKDSDGKPVADGSYAVFTAAPTASLSASGFSTESSASLTTVSGEAEWTFFMPVTAGTLTVSATTVSTAVLTAALRGAAVTVSATTAVDDSAAKAAEAAAKKAGADAVEAAAAAADAAAEAIDAANAATDAANLAAEAADAATVAAEEARDAADAATAAVEELATQVATLMAALKAQITTLANTVAKIAKKVKA